MVRTAADMTVRQIISLLFDRVADELGVTKFGAESVENNGVVVNGEGEGVSASGRIEVEDGVDGKGDGLGNAEGALRCAHLVFQVGHITYPGEHDVRARACVCKGGRVLRWSALIVWAFLLQ